MANNEIIVTGSNNPALVAKDLKVQVNVIQDVMRSVMKNGEHYGIIPGCGEKKVLLKSGAEKLLMAFRLGAEPTVEINETEDSVSYRVRVRLFAIADNNTVGWGIGECSSLEEKYLWRKAIGAEFNNTPESNRRVKCGYRGTIEQVKTNHHDMRNTVLKMAKKRALVDAVLTCTAASDIFTQDLEDWDESMIETLAETNNAAPTKPAPTSITPVSPKAKDVATKAQTPTKPVNNPTSTPVIVSSSDSKETIGEALRQIGLEPDFKGNFVAARGKTYGKSEMLKSLGFTYKADTKVWYRKVA
jgi:hypothetical protein